MASRRTFLQKLGHSALLTPFIPSGLHDNIREFPPARPVAAPDKLARNEAYWHTIQQAFSVDRSIIHLNSGGVCPTPLPVQNAVATHQNYAYTMPFYAHRRTLTPQLERVRKGIADTFGCDPEEVALTRNTSEGMEICQLGLDLNRGDIILTTNHDYPRMINTWKQRVQRDGIFLEQVPLPVPGNAVDILDLFKVHIKPQTRLIMICHMIDITGQIMPVKEIVDLAHQQGIRVLVDGAQAFGHINFTLGDLGCDFYATSLHKWMLGPPGTGFLYVAQDLINSVWPLMPASSEKKEDIRKFEDVGTQSLARCLSISEALAFHHAIGIEYKEARLRYLRDFWQNELSNVDRITFHTSNDPLFSAGLSTLEIEGIDSSALRDYLWNTHRIIVRPINHPSVKGIRISAGLHTTLNELEQLVTTIQHVVNHGIS